MKNTFPSSKGDLIGIIFWSWETDEIGLNLWKRPTVFLALCDFFAKIFLVKKYPFIFHERCQLPIKILQT